MKKLISTAATLLFLTLVIQFAGCNFGPSNPTTALPTPEPTVMPTPMPTPMVKIKELPVTLPLLDALFFVDRKFSERLKTDLLLTDEQISQLRQTVRAETANLQVSEDEDAIGRTSAAAELATEKIIAIIGPQKMQQLAELAFERWQAADEDDTENNGLIALATPSLSATLEAPGSAAPTRSPSSSPSPSPSSSMPAMKNEPGQASTMNPAYSVPGDTRIVINAPAYRMDVFRAGQLVKSYKIAIGYPEFPLPTGMRKASSIIINPTWTPPDEPWVESSKKVKVGELVAAGDKLNPLGVIKIPIGLPSLIHGGKNAARIGTFASHGCVGLTDKQVKDFSRLLASLGGVELSEDEIAKHQKTPTVTKSIRLKSVIPVELRYETIVVEDGKLHIYRDVYDRDTNVLENIEAILEMYGVMLSDLPEKERDKITTAIEAMASGPGGKSESANLTEAQKVTERDKNIARGRLTRQFKGQKVITIEIGALAGKGYPAPVDLDSGTLPKPAATHKSTKSRRRV